jgi:signal transduction histidine kinase
MTSWWRRLSLKARLMLIGVAGLAVGLAVGGLVLIAALGYALQRTVDGEALQTARGVARLVDENALPNPVPVAGVQVLVQVVDDHNRVRAASIDADRLTPVLFDGELARARAGERLFIPGDRIGTDGTVRVVAVTAGPADDRQTVLVAKSMADVAHGVRLLRTTLLIAFPLIVAALAAVAWRVVGATLRPVEALRQGAEEITGGVRPGQLPVPASRDEIRRLAVTLNDMLDRLDAARVRQRAFVADAAHELRSPLANMRTQLEVAQRLGDRTDWPAVSQDLLTDTERLSRLVDDLLLLAHADDAEPGRPDRGGRVQPVELGELVAGVAQRFPRPPVRVASPERPLWTLGDADELGRVVANLVDNAVRHTRTTVVVAAVADGPYHLLTVTDDGPGVPAADRERVFGRFTRLDDARARDGGGAGLGLAIVRELVRRNRGTVVLTDAAPGLRAEVRLRAADPPPGQTDRSGQGDRAAARAVQTGADESATPAGKATATEKQ